MIKLDDNLLAELGLHALPAEEKKNLLKHIYETLEMRVGTTLAQQMTDAQLDEFESFINSNDEAGALRWLETNFPNYKDVVAHEFEVLKHEVRQAAPQILASATAAPQQMPMQQPQYNPYQQMPQQPMMPQAPAQYAQPPMPQQPAQDYQQPPMPPQQQPVAPQWQQPPMPPTYQQMPPQQPHDQSQYDQAA